MPLLSGLRKPCRRNRESRRTVLRVWNEEAHGPGLTLNNVGSFGPFTFYQAVYPTLYKKKRKGG
jgi:hypothetical protein